MFIIRLHFDRNRESECLDGRKVVMKKLFGFVDCVATAGGLLALSSSVASPTAFIQDATSDGLVVIEAEHFSTNTPGGVHAWVLVTNGMASGGKAMQALPAGGMSANLAKLERLFGHRVF